MDSKAKISETIASLRWANSCHSKGSRLDMCRNYCKKTLMRSGKVRVIKITRKWYRSLDNTCVENTDWSGHDEVVEQSLSRR